MESLEVAGVSVNEDDADEDNDEQITDQAMSNERLIQVPTLRQTQTVADVHVSDKLPEEQGRQLRRLIIILVIILMF